MPTAFLLVLALALALGGLVGPVGATLISNGSGIAAGLNALRPLVDRQAGAVSSRTG